MRPRHGTTARRGLGKAPAPRHNGRRTNREREATGVQDRSGAQNDATVVEVVGRFSDRAPFVAAVEELLAQGFPASDLSVLDTHESLSAAGTPGEAWQEWLSGLVGEVNYVGPIAIAGMIALATGPVGAAISAAVAAGLTGAAMAELLATVRATPHTESFARALEAGAVLLWVRAEDSNRQDQVAEILRRHGAADVHVHERPKAQRAEAEGSDKVAR